MNILLINNNPVVSRLFSLCTNDENMVLEEVDNAGDIVGAEYEVVFVDEGSYEGDVLRLNDTLTIGKKILLSNADVLINDFNMTIQKPFLPSQIIEVLESVKASEVADDTTEEVLEEEETTSDETAIFPLSSEDSDEEKTEALENDEEMSSQEVLDSNEIEKIKALLDMDEESTEEETLSDEAYEERKIEVIKEQLIAEGLEIVDEEEIVEELSEKSDEVPIITFFNEEESTDVKVKKRKKMKSQKNDKKKNKSQKEKKKKIDFTAVDLARIEDAIEVAIATLKRKQMKKLLKGKEIEVTVKLEEL